MKFLDTSEGAPVPPPADGESSTVSSEQKLRIAKPLLEQSTILGLGIESLGQVSAAVARRIYIIDTLSFDLALRDREALFAYGLWRAADGKYKDVERFLVLSGRDATRAIDPVMEREELLGVYKKTESVSYVLSRVLPRGQNDLEFVKQIISQIAGLMQAGLSEQDIIQRLK